MYRGRGGEGSVEKTGRTDETGSPGCACSGAREQESGKSGMRLEQALNAVCIFERCGNPC